MRVQTSSATISIADCLIANNTANSGNGGGVFAQGPTTISNTTVRDNVSSIGGGGIWVQSGGSLVLTSSTVSGNSANQSTASGGGVFCQGPLTVLSSTIHNNRAGSGGGIAFFGAQTTVGTITHSTITDNRVYSALASGGGIRVSGSEAFSLGHSIVAGNVFEATVTNGTGPDISGAVNSLGYNLIQDASGATITGNAATNITGVAAGLGPLANNGGPTQTRLPQIGSPARDAGDPAFAPPPATDQRGEPRVQNGRIDIGAAEVGAAAPTVAGIQVNGGGAQRSMVRSLVVTFSEVVNFAGGDANAAAAFTLSRVGGGGNVGLQAAVSTDAQGRTVVTLTFTNANPAVIHQETLANGGPPSLANGRYQLSIADGAVTTPAGAALDGDNNGTPGGAYLSPLDTAGSGAGYHFGLFRLCGDITGNGVNDLLDLAAFRSTFNQTGPNPPNPAFLDGFDFDNNDVIDLVDLAIFRACFNANLFP
jgi:hypothetical protein